MKSKNAFKRTICFLLILASVALTNITPVYASQDLPSDIESNLDSFFYYMEIGDEQVYDYIDSSNEEIYDNVQQYMGDIDISYKIISSEENDGIYTVKIEIDASGNDWNVEGFSAQFEFQEQDSSYKIVNTTLFDIIGTKGVTKFVFSIFGIVVGILFLVGMLFVIAIIVVIIFIVHNKNKKNNLNKI